MTVTEYADLFTRPVRVKAPAEPTAVTVGLPAEVAVTVKLVAAGVAAGAVYVPASVPLPDVNGLASVGAPGTTNGLKLIWAGPPAASVVTLMIVWK